MKYPFSLWSHERLVGATLGGYLIVTVVLACWGRLLYQPWGVTDFNWGSAPAVTEFDLHALYLLIPGSMLFLFGMLQAHFGVSRWPKLAAFTARAGFLSTLGLAWAVAFAGTRMFELVDFIAALAVLFGLPVCLSVSLIDVCGFLLQRTLRAYRSSASFIFFA